MFSMRIYNDIDIVSKVKNMKEKIDYVMQEDIDCMVDEAMKNSPVKTGYLRSRNSNERISDMQYSFENDCDYAGTREFNTDNMPCGPQPFFYPAYEMYKDQLISDIEIAIKESL